LVRLRFAVGFVGDARVRGKNSTVRPALAAAFAAQVSAEGLVGLAPGCRKTRAALNRARPFDVLSSGYLTQVKGSRFEKGQNRP
ncbi:MAG: hypothetical protein PVF89_06775, partial [Lysobacterales bacterium]